jgi:hypothetical protein
VIVKTPLVGEFFLLNRRELKNKTTLGNPDVFLILPFFLPCGIFYYSNFKSRLSLQWLLYSHKKIATSILNIKNKTIPIEK